MQKRGNIHTVDLCTVEKVTISPCEGEFPGHDTFIIYTASWTTLNHFYHVSSETAFLKKNSPETQPPCHHQPAGRTSMWRTWNFEQSLQYRYTNQTKRPLLKLVWGGWSGPWAAEGTGWFNRCLIYRLIRYKYQKSMNPKVVSEYLPSSVWFQAQLVGWYSLCYKPPAPVTYCMLPGMLHTHRHTVRKCQTVSPHCSTVYLSKILYISICRSQQSLAAPKDSCKVIYLYYIDSPGLTSLTFLLAVVEACVSVHELANWIEPAATVACIHYGVLKAHELCKI